MVDKIHQMSNPDDLDGAPLEIGIDRLRDMLNAGAPLQLLDIRDGWECQICAVAESLHIPMAELPQRIGELSSDLPLLVLCHHGMRSYSAASWLRGAGFGEAASITGGIDAWAELVDPTMARY